MIFNLDTLLTYIDMEVLSEKLQPFIDCCPGGSCQDLASWLVYIHKHNYYHVDPFDILADPIQYPHHQEWIPSFESLNLDHIEELLYLNGYLMIAMSEDKYDETWKGLNHVIVLWLDNQDIFFTQWYVFKKCQTVVNTSIQSLQQFIIDISDNTNRIEQWNKFFGVNCLPEDSTGYSIIIEYSL